MQYKFWDKLETLLELVGATFLSVDEFCSDSQVSKPLYFYCLEISIPMCMLCNLFKSALTTARLPCSLVRFHVFYFMCLVLISPFSLSCLFILAFPNLSNHLSFSNFYSCQIVFNYNKWYAFRRLKQKLKTEYYSSNQTSLRHVSCTKQVQKLKLFSDNY